jgi:hypothetical protein
MLTTKWRCADRIRRVKWLVSHMGCIGWLQCGDDKKDWVAEDGDFYEN